MVTVLIDESGPDGLQHVSRGLGPIVVLVSAEHNEDVDVLKGLGLGVADVGAGQEVVLDVEGAAEDRTDSLLPAAGVLLFAGGQFKATLELREGFRDREQCRLLPVVERCAEAAAADGCPDAASV